MHPFFEIENLPADVQGQIGEHCEEFETSWMRGETPSLEQTLAGTKGPTRRVLLRELVEIERHYRRLNEGIEVSDDQLLVEHAHIGDELSQLFEFERRSASNSQTLNTPPSNPENGPRDFFEQFPTQFGRYQVLSRLGKGGMGSVYRAVDTQLNRQVALKLPQLDQNSDQEIIARFYREARAAASLSHPCLCSVYDVNETDGVHFLTMELVEGNSLADLILDRHSFSQRETAELIQQLAEAMSLAHDQGVVHRDLKPANIMMRPDGMPVVTDFGLAQIAHVEEATQITQVGQILGSPSYMSPEQIEGNPGGVGPASDIYSLGVIMYELLSGQRPFQGSAAWVMSQIVTQDTEPIRQSQEHIDAELDNICQKMLARETSNRYESMQTVAQVLTAWLENDASSGLVKKKSLADHRAGLGWKTITAASVSAVALVGIVVQGLIPKQNEPVTENVSQAKPSQSRPTRNEEKPIAVKTFDEQLALERNIAEWVIELGGQVSCKVKSGKPFYHIGHVGRLPDEPYLISAIYSKGKNNSELTLPDMSRINDLAALRTLHISQNRLAPDSLKRVQLRKATYCLQIQNTNVTTSQLASTTGLENIRQFDVAQYQIDDQFEILTHMPNLLELGIAKPTSETLVDLAKLPHFRNSKISRLKLFRYKTIDSSTVERLQALRPSLTIVGYGNGSQPRYLGSPVFQPAVKRLLSLGCTIKVFQPLKDELIYSNESAPNDEIPFEIERVTLPAGLQLNSEVVSDMNRLPLFFGFNANGILSADLLANVETLVGCAGLNLKNSDMGDAGFTALTAELPDAYFNIQGTEISKAAIEAAVEEFPLLSMHSKYGSYNPWPKNDRNLNRDWKDD